MGRRGRPGHPADRGRRRRHHHRGLRRCQQGAAYGDTKVWAASAAGHLAATGEILHARQRTGRANTARGIVRFVQELLGRLRRAGSVAGSPSVPTQSGFYSHALLGLLDRHQVDDTIPVRMNAAIRRDRGHPGDGLGAD